MATSGIDRRTASELAYDWLLDRIASREYPPGARLTQTEISQRLGISTTPVREAFRELAAVGIIDLDAHKGAFVRNITKGEVQDIYLVRMLLEPLAASLAAGSISNQQLAEAEAHHLAMCEKADDTMEWIVHNRAFHAVVADASQSPRLESILESLREASALYVGFFLNVDPAELVAANVEHAVLLEALKKRDADEAGTRARAHMHGIAERFRKFDG